METRQEFVDLYALLGVEPACDARTLEMAYHFCAKRYHPDNSLTADAEKFHEIVGAYKVLRSPDERAIYDEEYSRQIGEIVREKPRAAPQFMDERTAINDEQLHQAVLMQLYQKRRESPAEAGIVGWLLQERLGCSEESFEFLAWYLKAKSLISIDEQGKYAITIEGVDYVMDMSRKSFEQTLLIENGSTPPPE